MASVAKLKARREASGQNILVLVADKCFLKSIFFYFTKVYFTVSLKKSKATRNLVLDLPCCRAATIFPSAWQFQIANLIGAIFFKYFRLRDLFFLNFLLLYFQILRDFFHFRFSAEIELYDPLQDGQASRQAAAGSTHSRRRTTKRVATKVSDFQKSNRRL